MKLLNKCHFIGIGGIGMSSLARILLGRNMAVSGSDIAATAVTDSLSKEGAKVYIGHSAKYITPEMQIVYSTDIKPDNPEFAAARQLNCPILHRSELLQILMQNSLSLAVAGTHGKTTTASLLAWTLHCAHLSPSYAIGGIIPQLPHGTEGQGHYFVAEACESDGTFLNYTPSGAIVTNIDLDHMDYYKSEQHLVEAFSTFMQRVASPEKLFWCGEDARLSQLQPPGICYGLNPSFPLYVKKIEHKGWSSLFDLHFKGQDYLDIELPLPGEHSVLNATAVFGLCLSLGIDAAKIRQAFKSFKGVLRRFEKKGAEQGILFIDDYAHHPTELKAALKAIRQAAGERRIVAVYQPHRYTRAQACQGLYKGAFEQADELFVTEIYAAREKPLPGIDPQCVFKEMQREWGSRSHFATRARVAAELASFVRPHDIVVTLGAGDVTRLAGEVMTELAVKKVKKYRIGVICGGKSAEHDVSLMSSEFILSCFNPDYYEVETFAISRQGHWYAGPQATQALKAAPEQAKRDPIPSELFHKLMQCDILFPILHGTNGEDGTIQGFFEMLGKPYIGPDYRACALTMDKALTKRLAKEAGLPVLPFISFDCYAWEADQQKILAEIEASLRYPLFVKPVHLGSSIGVKKVKQCQELLQAILEAFRLDTCVIVENGIEAREIEFAVLGNGEVTVFPPGEVFPDAEICSYAGKYFSAGRDPDIIAQLPPELVAKGIELVRTAYKSTGCIGMSRIDTFLDKNGTFWLNEINPLPGCTKNSPFPKMCQAHGLSGQGLIDRLIVLSLERRRRLDRLHI